MKLFLKDEKEGTHCSYDAILSIIRATQSLASSQGYHYLQDFYLHFIQALVEGKDIQLSDFNFPELRIETIPSDKVNQLATSVPVFKDIGALIQHILQSEVYIHLYTSGTSGQPKRVTHSIQNLIAMARVGSKYQADAWALAYNPTHMAGLQVFFQAFLNQNPLFNLFGLPTQEIDRILQEEPISHISASPTFYRMLLNTTAVYSSVRRITTGGERLDSQLYRRLQKSFPNARIHNIYSTTESGTLLVSHNDQFRIPEKLNHKIKIVGDELMIHRSLLGDFDAEANSERWYATGDRVRWIDEHSFSFVGRTTSVVNVAGYRVDLEEIKEKVSRLEEVQSCQIFARPNALIGHIVCCDMVVKDKNTKAIQIKRQLAGQLPNYKIPRIIRFVDQLQSNHRGKTKGV